jgi:hypothetical protein
MAVFGCLTKSRTLALAAIALVAASGALAIACEDDGDGGGGGSDEAARLFSPQGNQLDVYDVETLEGTVLIAAEQNTVNGQVCLVPDGDGKFLLGEDTGQPEQRMGWGIFSPEGELLQKIPEPESDDEAEQPEPYGCGFSDDGLLFTTDIGSGNFGAEDGKLIVFFPDEYESFCILDSTIRTAGQIGIDDDGNVYLTESVPPGRVQRYEGPFPASADECESVKPTKSVFIEDPDLNTPLGIAHSSDGHWYVSSVLLPLPTIREYDENGEFVRAIIVGTKSIGDPIGNPSGLSVAADGTLYYADLGLEEKPEPQFYGPADNAGTIRVITFDADGNPQPPVTIGEGLNYPDSVTVVK